MRDNFYFSIDRNALNILNHLRLHSKLDALDSSDKYNVIKLNRELENMIQVTEITLKLKLTR